MYEDRNYYSVHSKAYQGGDTDTALFIAILRVRNKKLHYEELSILQNRVHFYEIKTKTSQLHNRG